MKWQPKLFEFLLGKKQEEVIWVSGPMDHRHLRAKATQLLSNWNFPIFILSSPQSCTSGVSRECIQTKNRTQFTSNLKEKVILVPMGVSTLCGRIFRRKDMTEDIWTKARYNQWEAERYIYIYDMVPTKYLKQSGPPTTQYSSILKAQVTWDKVA